MFALDPTPHPLPSRVFLNTHFVSFGSHQATCPWTALKGKGGDPCHPEGEHPPSREISWWLGDQCHGQGHPSPRAAGAQKADLEQTSSTKSQQNTPKTGEVGSAPCFMPLPSHSPALASESGSAWPAERQNPAAPTHHQRVTEPHRGCLYTPGPSLRWPKRCSSCPCPGTGHSRPQHEHQPCKANMVSSRAWRRDRTEPPAQRHPLKSDGIYFSPLNCSQADVILCKLNTTTWSTRNNEHKGCNISAKRNQNQPPRSRPSSYSVT